MSIKVLLAGDSGVVRRAIRGIAGNSIGVVRQSCEKRARRHTQLHKPSRRSDVIVRLLMQWWPAAPEYQISTPDQD